MIFLKFHIEIEAEIIRRVYYFSAIINLLILSMAKIHSKKHVARPVIFSILIFSYVYAIVRYHIAGPVPWKDIVFFVSNKAISMGALIILTLNFSLKPLSNLGFKISDQWLNSRKYLGFVGFVLAITHVFMSVMLFKPEVYSKFFEENSTVTFYAGISMLGGVLGFTLLWIYNKSFDLAIKKDNKLVGLITSKQMLLVILFTTGIHLFFMGFEGWLKPAGWHGGMPPISLVSFVVLVLGVAFNLRGRS